ncbi:MAG: glycine--tRNA ligase subunit beta [Rickettsiaceae bacterium]|nr:MAG: glycine--tRNA ligase subunit beta [Rickettsiaceae bacterium]
MKKCELILELYSEELPALMQVTAEKSYLEIFTKTFQDYQLVFDKIIVLSSAMRIAVHVTGLIGIIAAKTIEIKGPKIDAPLSAIEGFCKSHNIDKSSLSEKLVNKQYFYFYNKLSAQIETRNLLEEILPVAINKHVWPKTMKWGTYNLAWIRPLRNVLCLFDGKTLPIKLAHLIANDITYGHRFIAPKKIIIKSWLDYLNLLTANHVIVDRIERRKIINQQFATIASNYNLTIKEDVQLLEEVCGLVEFPQALIGSIDQKFMTLPAEILSTSMRINQKYFSLLDKDGTLAAYFLCLTNSDQNDMLAVLKGNERVLSARLADALFFYNQDLSISLTRRLQDLEKVIFHTKLGSIKDKTDRIVNICKYLSPGNVSLIIAAGLCKSDLVSQVVTEFPELQGTMGYYYALNDGLDYEVAEAIRDHYKPMGLADSIPVKNSAMLSIADKIDSLVGLMSIGEQPNGSKDPYAIRRMALGIIRIILENNLNINLIELIDHALTNFGLDANQNIVLFFEERTKFYFKNNYDLSLINSVLELNTQDNLVLVQHKLHVLKEFMATSNGQQLLATYKRIKNILLNCNSLTELSTQYFVTSYEHELHKIWRKTEESINNQKQNASFLALLNELLVLSIPIENFFVRVMVKDENPSIANNRLALLNNIKNLFEQVCKFDLL